MFPDWHHVVPESAFFKVPETLKTFRMYSTSRFVYVLHLLATRLGDEDASRDPRSVETGSHAKRIYSTHITPFTDQRGCAQWSTSMVWTCPKKRCEHRHSQSDGPES